MWRARASPRQLQDNLQKSTESMSVIGYDCRIRLMTCMGAYKLQVPIYLLLVCNRHPTKSSSALCTPNIPCR